MPEDDTPTPEDDRQDTEDMKILRKKAKNHDDAVKRAEAAERRLALRDARIPDSPLGKLFEKGYDGDWTDVEAIRSAAVEYGILDPPEPEVPADEQQAQQRVEQVSAGATADPGTDWDSKLAEAKTEDEFYATYAQSGRPMKGRG